MNLVMPLKDKTAIGRAQAALVIGSSLDEIYSGLDNVGRCTSRGSASSTTTC
jgi:hypothetical protein